MTKTDTSYIKPKLREYLQRKGITITKNKLRCPNPDHQDSKPSAILYENASGDHVVTCMSQCGESWDIFELAGMLDNARTFPEQLQAVKDTLSITDIPKTEASPPPLNKKKKKIDYVSLEKEDAKKIYTKKAACKIADFIYKDKNYTLANQWPYFDKDGKLICMDIRFEFPSSAGEIEKKQIITFWYDGKNLKTKGPPNVIYNLDEIFIHPDKPILISEGCKCAEISRALKIFTPCAWNGGTGRVSYIDWTVLKDYEIYILHDDDSAGLKAALKIKDQLQHAKIITPPEKIREIKKKGGDIEEILQIMSDDELTKYIIESPGMEASPTTTTPVSNTPAEYPKTEASVSGDSIPFKILGVADDGFAYYLDESDRLRAWALDSMNKNKLMVLAPRSYWYEDYQNREGKISWESALDDIIRISLRKDFNLDNVRGRGAWREKDGRICYHDGKNTIGEFDKSRLFLRKALVDIGLKDKPAELNLCVEIKNTVSQMSFETKVDAVRCLAWSILAPFAGALPWRPALLITGDSGSGKTTLANKVVRPLAEPLWLDGIETTPAYLRSRVNKDSCAVVFEETEADTKKKKENRDALFSIMRVSTSDDAPDSGKGTKDGGYRSSKMQNMFAFIGTDPTIDSVADENRIFRINMVRPTNGSSWKKLERDLKKLLSIENCRSIRSLTWIKLKTILELSIRLADIVMRKSNKDYRSSFADAILCSAYIVIFGGMENPSDEKIDDFFEKYYKLQPPDEVRYDAEETINRLFDEVIEIIHDGRREKITIIECLNRIENGAIISDEDDKVTEKVIRDTKLTISRYGIKLLDDGEVAICNSHHLVRQIIQRGKGYSKLFKRHKGFVEASRVVSFSDNSRRCTIIKGIIKTDIDKNLENLIF